MIDTTPWIVVKFGPEVPAGVMRVACLQPGAPMPPTPHQPARSDDRNLQERLVAELNASILPHGMRAHLADDGRLHLHAVGDCDRNSLLVAARYEIGGGVPLVEVGFTTTTWTVRAGGIEVVIHWPVNEDGDEDGPEDFGDHSAATFGFYEGM